MHTDHIFPNDAVRRARGQADRNTLANCSRYRDATKDRKKARLPTKAMAAKVDPAFWPNGITMDMLTDIYPGWRTPLRM